MLLEARLSGRPGESAAGISTRPDDARPDLADHARRRVSLSRRAPRIALNPAKPRSRAPDNLTSRELDVLRLLAIGRSNADIAIALEIGQSTVATHVHSILAKTGCANRTEAAAYAARHGLQAS